MMNIHMNGDNYIYDIIIHKQAAQLCVKIIIRMEL